MREFTQEIEQYRVKEAGMPPPGSGRHGVFAIPINSPINTVAYCIATEGMKNEAEWEHVSVSIAFRNIAGNEMKRTPRWEEMEAIKQLFWEDEECVIQYHPPRSVYINDCNFCLHMWKPWGDNVKMPATNMVGFKVKDFENQQKVLLPARRKKQ